MTKRILCLGFVLAASLGVALALEIGDLIKDYGVVSGTGVAVFSTDAPGIRAAVVYRDVDESGDYSEADSVIGVKYFTVLRERPTEPLFRSPVAPRFGVRP